MQPQTGPQLVFIRDKDLLVSPRPRSSSISLFSICATSSMQISLSAYMMFCALRLTTLARMHSEARSYGLTSAPDYPYFVGTASISMLHMKARRS